MSHAHFGDKGTKTFSILSLISVRNCLTLRLMDAIYLIGYMGCGKTTLGRALAARCDIEFVDLDDYIEAKDGRLIREIFESDGEAAFRHIEREALEEVSKKRNVLVACGGGTPCFGDNMELMNSRGVTVHLSACRPRLISRLKEGKAKRPLIAPLSDAELERFVDKQLAARMGHYEKAKSMFDSSFLENEKEIEQSCETFITQFNLPLKNL